MVKVPVWISTVHEQTAKPGGAEYSSPASHGTGKGRRYSRKVRVLYWRVLGNDVWPNQKVFLTKSQITC